MVLDSVSVKNRLVVIQTLQQKRNLLEGSWGLRLNYAWGHQPGSPWKSFPGSAALNALLVCSLSKIQFPGKEHQTGQAWVTCPPGGREAPPDYAWCRRDHSNQGNKVAIWEKWMQSGQNPTHFPCAQQHCAHGSVAVPAIQSWEHAGWRSGGNLQQLGGC